MLTNLVSALSKSLSGTNVAPVKNKEVSYNPFSSNSENANPFLSTSFGTSAYYGKNQPVAGGYFAGYYNGKPNIVGRKLFIEV
ncbi:MAG: hypothetical protein IJ877_02075 [Candidatus Gastranaerophilales bacterium]|nr:hypothetical protein [Candidatus Gastranaerophilales bacterium]